jgi:hypothetical protein
MGSCAEHPAGEWRVVRIPSECIIHRGFCEEVQALSGKNVPIVTTGTDVERLVGSDSGFGESADHQNQGDDCGQFRTIQDTSGGRRSGGMHVGDSSDGS